MSEQPDSWNRAEEGCVDRFQPVFIGAVFNESLERLVSAGDQVAALFHVEELTVICLAHGCVCYVGGDAEELTEQIDRFTDVPINEADGCGFVIQAEGGVLLSHSVEREMTCESVLFEDQ